MIADNEVPALLARHEEWVSGERHKWERYRDAYGDDFWRRDMAAAADRRRPTLNNETMRPDPVRIELNVIRPWVTSFVASLFYRAPRMVVRADDVDQVEEVKAEADLVRRCADRWLNLQGISAISKRAYALALMYPHAAFKLQIDESYSDDPLQQVELQVIPAWEAMWDREAAPDTSRFYGHLQELAKEEVLWHGQADRGDARWDVVEEDLNPHVRTDVVRAGSLPTARAPRTGQRDEPAFVRVLEFWDQTVQQEIDGRTVWGEYRVYLLDSTRQAGAGQPMHLLFKGPLAFHLPNGRPAPPIEPIVLAHVVEHPLSGLPLVATVYHLAAEKNYVHTAVAQAFRKDVSRILMFLKDKGIDEDVLAAWESGEDSVAVGVEHNTLEGIAAWMPQQPVSDTIVKWARMLEDATAATETRAPMARGEALKYATATEVDNLNAYTETNLGIVRSVFDTVTVRLVSKYLAVLRVALEMAGQKSVRFLHEEQVVELPAEALSKTWHLELADVAATPSAEAKQRQDLAVLMKPLLELVEIASGVRAGGEAIPPAQQVIARLLIRRMVQLYQLPTEFLWENVQAAASAIPVPAPPPPPAVAEGPPVDAGGGVPGAPPSGVGGILAAIEGSSAGGVQ